MENTELIDGAVPHGGFWTLQKLDLLEKYLDAYTTALHKQTFQLLYIDAFAGSGKVHIRKDNSSHPGSALRALRIRHRPFDKLIFVDLNSKYCQELEQLKKDHPTRNIRVCQNDANAFILTLSQGLQPDVRGVLFLDPFGAQVDFETLQAVAQCKTFDIWLMFSLAAVLRMLPRRRCPEGQLTQTLDRVFGTPRWRTIYRDVDMVQADFSGHPEFTEQRKKYTDAFLGIYKFQLESAFGNRLLAESYRFLNSRNAPLFELFFCAGHPAGTAVAHRIARHLIADLKCSDNPESDFGPLFDRTAWR